MSSSPGKRSRRSLRGDKVSSDDMYDQGSWECTVCTYRNSAESFHCIMCDTRKGTSTRKPKLNSAVVQQQQTVHKFVQQQAAMLASELREKEKQREKASCSKPTSVVVKDTKDYTANNSPLKADSPAVTGSNVSSPAPSTSMTPTPQPYSPLVSDSNSATSNRSTPRQTTKKIILDRNRSMNLDLNSARTLAVTVNNVTVIITDYKLNPIEPKEKKSKRKRMKTGKKRTDDSENDDVVRPSTEMNKYSD
ncbi:unnamed protein product [Soboliphyme baturini]|uniref:RanBP2-type domain-containing protein n=1 Tax=Soboliphyme baturini TaxID=241478 RepID=A0A183IGN8_9BILA|nr:unnamed protein product [Soboliphyme baturini]